MRAKTKRPDHIAPAGNQNSRAKFAAPEDEFVAEMCRKYLVSWAEQQVLAPQGWAGLQVCSSLARYLELAKQKKWVNADGSRVLAAGFKVAAAFLRR